MEKQNSYTSRHFSGVQLSATPWTVAHQAPLSMRFSRQEHWSGLPCPPPGDLPDQGIKPKSLVSPALIGGFFITSTTWETQLQKTGVQIMVQRKPSVNGFIISWVFETQLLVTILFDITKTWGQQFIKPSSWDTGHKLTKCSPQEKEMQKGKMAVWGGLTHSCEKKRSKKQRRKGKIYPSECRVPKNSKER